MRVNRITFSKVKQQYDILKFAAGLLYTDSQVLDQDNFTEVHNSTDLMFYEEMTPEQFHEMHTPVSAEDREVVNLKTALKRMEDQGRKFLEEEKYELMDELKDLYEQTKKQLNNKLNKL